MKENEIKKETLQHMYGEWQGHSELKENGKPVFEYCLKIDKNETKFTVKKDGVIQKDDTFGTSSMHWVEDYLYYWNTNKYFITYANERQIEFGELSTLGNFNGKYEFFAKLDRIQS